MITESLHFTHYRQVYFTAHHKRDRQWCRFKYSGLMKEIQSIVERGVPKPKILVSDRAQMVMPYHILFDQYEEERLGGKSFGSTKSGIAPFYSDKYAKIGFQVSELFDEELLKKKLSVLQRQRMYS